jgi:serine/threonine-protein kinase
MNEVQRARDTLIGGMLLGRYRVVRELAKGGMGVLYLARVEGAVGFVKPVVVKLILPEHASDERFLRMFAREAQIVSQLRHPSVVDVLEFAEQDGAYIMVLEYVRGHHLGQWLRYLQLTGRRISTEIAIQVTIDVLDALHHAHSLSHPDGTPMHIVHRDVSPSNILLDEDGRARLLDFGVARMRGGALDYQTQARGFVGKLSYTAPEMFEGSEASSQSDLYACAVVLHEALLGRNVFKGDNQAETMQRTLQHVPEPIASVRADAPAGLDAVLRKALAKLPAERFATCREFGNALRDLLPVSESEVHLALAAMLKHDFGLHMAELLGIESLAERDAAWRRLGLPTRRTATLAFDPRVEPPRPSAAPTPAAPDEEESTRDRRPARLTGRAPRSSVSGAPEGGGRPVASTDASWSKSPEAQTPEGPTRAERVDDDSTPDAGRPALPDERESPAAVRVQPPTVARARHGSSWPRATQRIVLLGGFALLATVIALAVTWEAPAPPAFRVVSTPMPQPPELTPTPGPGSKSHSVPTPATEGEVAPPVRVPPKTTSAVPGRAQSNALRLTLAFREQQSKIEACFAGHPQAWVDQPEIEVAFDLEASGRIKRVQVLPKSFASTPIGACVERVARTTRFPKQARTISFTIPVRASRGRPQ